MSDDICHHPSLHVCVYAFDVNSGNAYYVRFLLAGSCVVITFSLLLVPLFPSYSGFFNSTVIRFYRPSFFSIRLRVPSSCFVSLLLHWACVNRIMNVVFPLACCASAFASFLLATLCYDIFVSVWVPASLSWYQSCPPQVSHCVPQVARIAVSRCRCHCFVPCWN
jgi:hypothetical protein